MEERKNGHTFAFIIIDVCGLAASHLCGKLCRHMRYSFWEVCQYLSMACPAFLQCKHSSSESWKLCVQEQFSEPGGSIIRAISQDELLYFSLFSHLLSSLGSFTVYHEWIFFKKFWWKTEDSWKIKNLAIYVLLFCSNIFSYLYILLKTYIRLCRRILYPWSVKSRIIHFSVVRVEDRALITGFCSSGLKNALQCILCG